MAKVAFTAYVDLILKSDYILTVFKGLLITSEDPMQKY